MKKILILLLSIISFVGFSQTVLDPSLAASGGRINAALQESIVLSGTDTYTATKAGVTYTSGYAYDFTFTNANTGTTPTVNLNNGSGALGAKSIRKKSAGALISVAANDLYGAMRLRYDGTFFVIDGIGNIGSGGGSVASVSGTANQIASTGGTTPVISIVTNPIFPGAPTIVSPGNSTQNIVTTDATQTLSNKTLTTPNIGTATGNITGNAATVTTNANLIGDVTSTGNATSIASGVIVDDDVNASAAIAGTKLANTAAGGISSTTVQAAINELDTEKANLASPTFTGTPSLPAGATATTQSAYDNSTKLSTTAYTDRKVDTKETFTRQTASYTINGNGTDLTDLAVGKSLTIEMNVATANNLTVPPNSTAAFLTGARVTITQYGVGATTIVAGSGVTIRAYGNVFTLAGQYSSAVLEKVGTDEWYLWVGTTVPGSAMTVANDANVTITQTGNPSVALLAPVQLNIGWTGSLGVTRGGSGTATQFTAGSVVFAGSSGVYTQDNTNLFFDDTNNRLGIGTATPTSKLEIPAGSTTANTAPIELNSGARETTPRAGLIQYTTPQLFFTNGGLIDQEIQQVQQSRVSTQFDATSNTTLANVTGLTSSLAAGKIYRFKAVLYTTSNVAGGVKFAIAGTATATSIIYEAINIDANVNAAQTRATSIATTVGAATAVTNAYVTITGLIVCNAAGTLTVQFAQNASSGTASSVLVGSNFEVNEML